jgi:thymidylate kinase
MELYYIAGTDGSGKTAHLEYFVERLSEKSDRVRHVWLRSPKLITKPLLLLCRLVGLTKYKEIEGFRVGEHQFSRSRWIARIYPWLQYIDTCIFDLLKVKRPLRKGWTLVLDRYVLDTLADVMIATPRFDLHRRMPGRLLLELLPQEAKTVVLDVTADTVKMRKKEAGVHPRLLDRISVYQRLAGDLNLKLVDNNCDFEAAAQEIRQSFFNSTESSG